MDEKQLIEERRQLNIRLDRSIDHTRYDSDVQERIQAMNRLKVIGERLSAMANPLGTAHLSVSDAAGQHMYSTNTLND
ncbi:MAG: hypothetical protein WAT41_14450 [Flavobacteriales bacterium]